MPVGTHWKEQKLMDATVGGEKIPMSRHYVYNEQGLMLGRVEKTSTGFWKAYAGRPGILIGVFDTLSEGKNAVEHTFGE